MAKTIHALLVEDNRIEARSTQHSLAAKKEASIEVEWVDQLGLALERLEQGGIDVILLDLNLPDSRGLETFTRLYDRFPDVPVIILTGEHDESIGVTAVENGASDYLVKQQLEGGMLPKIVQFTVARNKAQVERITKELVKAPARVLTFLGAKGGVGTTTTALNVAVAIAERGKSVILAELKPTFGGIAFSCQTEPTSNLGRLLDLPASEIGEHEVASVLCQGPANLRILFGASGEIRSELDADQVEKIVKALSQLADFVILDLPGWPTIASSTATCLSHYVTLVTLREPLAIRCGQAAVKQMKAWGVKSPLIGAVIVGQSNVPLSMELSAVRSLIDCPILRLIPPSAAACYKAYIDRVPLVLAQPDNEASEAYLEIAEMLTDERGVRAEGY